MTIRAWCPTVSHCASYESFKRLYSDHCPQVLTGVHHNACSATSFWPPNSAFTIAKQKMHSFFDINLFAGKARLDRLWELVLDWSIHWVTTTDIQLYHVWNLEKLGHSCGPWLNTVLPLSSSDTRIHACTQMQHTHSQCLGQIQTQLVCSTLSRLSIQ